LVRRELEHAARKHTKVVEVVGKGVQAMAVTEFQGSDDRVVRISSNAFERLLALRDEELAAARALALGNSYGDFFVEGSRPWHEAFTDVITAGGPIEQVSAARMAYVDRVAKLRAGDDTYPDYFVEGSGPAWHEYFPDVVREGDGLATDVGARTRALASLRVMEAFVRLREASQADR
jgi:hypothetical protein